MTDIHLKARTKYEKHHAMTFVTTDTTRAQKIVLKWIFLRLKWPHVQEIAFNIILMGK